MSLLWAALALPAGLRGVTVVTVVSETASRCFAPRREAQPPPHKQSVVLCTPMAGTGLHIGRDAGEREAAPANGRKFHVAFPYR